jgi:hypothetical protein
LNVPDSYQSRRQKKSNDQPETGDQDPEDVLVRNLPRAHSRSQYRAPGAWEDIPCFSYRGWLKNINRRRPEFGLALSLPGLSFF